MHARCSANAPPIGIVMPATRALFLSVLDAHCRAVFMFPTTTTVASILYNGMRRLYRANMATAKEPPFTRGVSLLFVGVFFVCECLFVSVWSRRAASTGNTHTRHDMFYGVNLSSEMHWPRWTRHCGTARPTDSGHPWYSIECWQLSDVPISVHFVRNIQLRVFSKFVPLRNVIFYVTTCTERVEFCSSVGGAQ